MVSAGAQTACTYRRQGLLIFVFCLALYTLTHAGRIMHGDDETMYRVVRNIIERGDIAISHEVIQVPAIGYAGLLPTHAYEFETTFATPGRGGRAYSKYGIGQSLLAIPLYLAGKITVLLVREANFQIYTKLFVTLVNPVLSALACTTLFFLIMRLGYPQRIALFLTFAYGFSTMAWAYAKSFFSEPAVTWLFLLAALSLLRIDGQRVARLMAQVGIALGAAILFRVSAAIALPAFALALALRLRETGNETWPIRGWAAFFAGPLIAGVVTLAYNWARFNSWFSTGYTEVAWDNPFIIGFYGQLFSSGKSIFLYNPVLIAAPVGLGLLVRRQRSLVFLVAALTITYLLAHAPYNYWTGGWNWGPRFLLPVVPFLVLALAPLLTGAYRRMGWALVIILALAGLFLTLPAILVDHSRHLIALSEQYGESFYTRSIFEPSLSPAFRQWPAAVAVLRLFGEPGARQALQAALERDLTIEPMKVAPLDRASARLSYQAELLRLNAPDFWWLHLYFLQHASLTPLAVICAGLIVCIGLTGLTLFLSCVVERG